MNFSLMALSDIDAVYFFLHSGSLIKVPLWSVKIRSVRSLSHSGMKLLVKYFNSGKDILVSRYLFFSFVLYLLHEVVLNLDVYQNNSSQLIFMRFHEGWIEDIYLRCTDTGYIEPDPPVKSRGGMIRQESMPQELAPPVPPVLRREWVYLWFKFTDELYFLNVVLHSICFGTCKTHSLKCFSHKYTDVIVLTMVYVNHESKSFTV